MTMMLLALAIISAPQDAAAPTRKTAPAEKKICRRETPIGSRLSKRVCRTAAEWAAADEANQQAAGASLQSRNTAR